jgi:hypothetical protein
MMPSPKSEMFRPTTPGERIWLQCNAIEFTASLCRFFQQSCFLLKNMADPDGSLPCAELRVEDVSARPGGAGRDVGGEPAYAARAMLAE